MFKVTDESALASVAHVGLNGHTNPLSKLNEDPCDMRAPAFAHIEASNLEWLVDSDRRAKRIVLIGYSDRNDQWLPSVKSVA